MPRLATLVLLTVVLVGCGMSQEERQNIAAVTCSIMGETRNMDAAIRVEKINDAREKLGEPPYLAGDDGIKESFEWGLCQQLVLNDPTYLATLSELQRIAAEERRQREERERIAREEREEREAEERLQRAQEARKAREAEDPPNTVLSEAELAALTRAEIEAALAADIQSDSGASATLRDRVSATIRLAVINRWTRPPSARNGMLAVLEIQLVPTGDVVSVSVEQSSGDNAFDRSAINAVEKAARFPEVAQLDARTFERDFRRFTLTFQPHDLRY